MKVGILLLFTIFLSSPAFATKADDVKRGNELFSEQKFPLALEKYQSALKKDEESAIINFNIGTALYKQNEFLKAVPHFEKSLLAEDQQLNSKAHYNLANTFFKAGQAIADKNIAEGIANLEKSLGHYEKASRFNAKDDDVLHNQRMVREELDRLKQKQKEKKEQQNQQKDPDQQNQQENKDQQKEQNPQDQKGQNQPDSNSPPKEDPSSEQESQASKDQTSQADKDKQAEDQKKKEEQARRDQEKEKKEMQTGAGEKSDASKEKGSDAGETEKNGEPLGAKELSQKEAQMILDNYKENEEPKGLWNMLLPKQGTAPAVKDW